MTLFQASLADSIASVTWIGTTADTSTNINLRGMAGNATLRWVVARGFWSEMDGGGGLFAWDPTVIGTDDGGTVIVPDAGGSVTGCWRRVYSGPMDVRWFGCKCDGATDDAARLQMALDAVPSGGQLILSGLMAVGSPGWAGLLIHRKTEISLIGLHDACGIKILHAPTHQVRGEPPGALALQACARVQIRGILFDGNAVGSNFTALYLDFLADSIVTDCVFRNM